MQRTYTRHTGHCRHQTVLITALSVVILAGCGAPSRTDMKGAAQALTTQQEGPSSWRRTTAIRITGPGHGGIVLYDREKYPHIKIVENPHVANQTPEPRKK